MPDLEIVEEIYNLEVVDDVLNLEVVEEIYNLEVVAEQGVSGLKGDKGDKGDPGEVAATLPATSITDLDNFIEAETETGNLVLWFENQLL